MQMRSRGREMLVQRVIACALLSLAFVRVLGPGWQGRMDVIFFTVVGIAAGLCFIPVSRFKTVKAGSLELTVEQPEVAAAIGGLQLTQIQNDELREAIESAKNILAHVRGSRVLWIDDRPEKIVALRRVLRTLGVEIICAVSSESAKEMLTVDADYDLLISDVQREGETHISTGGIDIHEGTNFIVWLRTQHSDPVVRQMPVAFYAAYDWKRLVEFTEPARKILPEPTISNAVPDFVNKVIHQIAKSRSTSLTASGEKEPTVP